MIQVLLNGVVYGLVLSVVAIGFSLTYQMGVFHIAHGAAFTVAGYVFAAALESGGLVGATAFAAASAISVGGVTEGLVYTRLLEKNGSPLALFIASLGAYTVWVNTFALVFGSRPVNIASNPRVYTLGDSLKLSSVQFCQISGSLLLVVFVILVLRLTTIGRQIRALASNRRLASTYAIDPVSTRRLVFAVASALAGVAGILVAVDTHVVPYGGLDWVLLAAVAVIAGGTASIAGIVGMSILAGVGVNLATWMLSGQWATALAIAALVIGLGARPRGLFASSKRLEEIEGH